MITPSKNLFLNKIFDPPPKIKYLRLFSTINSKTFLMSSLFFMTQKHFATQSILKVFEFLSEKFSLN